MTKKEFHALVAGGVETLLSMPDDLWDSGYAVLRVRLKGSHEAVLVGIEEVHDGKDSDGDA